MASLSLQHVYKVYDNGTKKSKGDRVVKPAVSDFCMEIADKEFIVFVGPSGCGKSTTLRMIAGLEEITSGELYIDGKLVNSTEPKDRDIAMVFQNYALYPHMSVYENMAFGLKLRKLPKEDIDRRVRDAAEILDITEYLDRKPKALSGGQRQRVALGRAIVRNPKVFLLDEPLSNLDAKLRAAMRTEITKLHDRLQTTFIYVTHDQIEAMTMGSRIVVMKEGVISQIDTPRNLYDYPQNKFVASFIGTPQMNFFSGVIDKQGEITFANDQRLVLPKSVFDNLDKGVIGDKLDIVLGIRPEDLHFDPDNRDLTCHVDLIEELGSDALMYGSLDLSCADSITNEKSDLAIVAKIASRGEINRGENVGLSVDKTRLHIFDKNTEVSLLTKFNGQTK